MIYDAFTFFNEFDILKMRLEELSPVVDKFVIVESNYTFSGKPKPYYFWQKKHEFERYADKIIHVAHVMPALDSSWHREYDQRNGISIGLSEATDEDIVMVSDADEIPRRSVVESLDTSLEKQAIGLNVFYYGLNTQSIGDEHTIRAVKYGYFRNLGAQAVRTEDPNTMPLVHNAGWHFSYLGDVEHIITKFQSFAHTELDRPDTNNPEILLERMRSHSDLWGDGHHYEAVEIDDTWPEAVKRDREYWRKYEW